MERYTWGVNSSLPPHLLDWAIFFALLLFAYYLGVYGKRYLSDEKTKRHSLLSDWIEERSSEICKPKRQPLTEIIQEQIYSPSPASLVLVSLFVAAVSFIPPLLFQFPTSFLPEEQRNFLLTIHAGIGAIIFALVIFVAESFKEGKSETARVLLRESLLFPLTVAEIEIFLYFLMFKENIILPLLLVGGFAIYSLYRLIGVLLSRYKFSQSKIQFLKDRVKSNIQQALKERIGNNLLITEWLEKEKVPLQYSPFTLSIRKKDKYYHIYAKNTGTISNIRLDTLREIANLVDSEAEQNGFTFGDTSLPERAVSPDPQTQGFEPRASRKNDDRYLVKKFYDEVSDENMELMSFDRALFGDDEKIAKETLAKLQSLADSAFSISKQENYAEEMRSEMGVLKDQFIQSIRHGNIDETENHIKTYLSLVESFLEFLRQCGGGFSYEQAEQERKNFFGEWNEPNWIFDAVREAIDVSIASGNRTIIRKVIFIPYAISLRSIHFKDQYIFQKFISLANSTAYIADKLSDMGLQKFVNERNLQYLKETLELNIVADIRYSDDEAEITKAAEAARYMYLVFEGLLKTHFEAGNANDFIASVNTLEKVYNESRLEVDPYSSMNLENLLSVTKDPSARKEVEKKLARAKTLEKITEEISQRKKELYFGFSAWILNKIRVNQANTPVLRPFFDSLASKIGNDLEDITKIFISLFDMKRSDFWGWDWWDLAADGEVHTINTHDWLTDFYCVKSLQILSNKSDAEIGNIELPISRTLASLIEQGGILTKLLDGIAGGSRTLGDVLSSAGREKVPSFIKLLEDAKQRQEQYEQQQLQEMPIDEKRVESFWKDFIQSYRQSAALRKIIEQCGSFVDKSEEKETQKMPHLIGYNQLDLKEAFVENWHVSYVGHGESYGRGFANSENVMIFEKILESVSERKEISEPDLLSEVKQVLDTKKLKNPVLLGSVSYNLFRRTLHDEVKGISFIARWDWEHKEGHNEFEGIHSYQGYIKYGEKKIPVFDLMLNRLSPDNLFLLSLPDFGVLEQYPPRDNDEEKEYQRGIFSLQIIDLARDEEGRKKLIANDPEWLRKHEDKEGYLKRKIIIKVFEKFEYLVKDPSVGVHFRIVKGSGSL